MQKVINVLAVLSFVGTAGIVGGGTALYLNKDSIDAGMPELPDATGGALPLPTTTGPALPF